MTREEFSQIGDYAASLWGLDAKGQPKFALTAEQAEVWLDRLRRLSVESVRNKLANCYAAKDRYAPSLEEVLSAKSWATSKRQAWDTSAADPEQVEQLREQIAQEKADINDALSNFTRQELEDYKVLVLDQEPDRRWMERMPVTSQHWKDLLYNRFVLETATFWITAKNGHRVEKTMPRQEYWAMLFANRPKPKPRPTPPPAPVLPPRVTPAPAEVPMEIDFAEILGT